MCQFYVSDALWECNFSFEIAQTNGGTLVDEKKSSSKELNHHFSLETSFECFECNAQHKLPCFIWSPKGPIIKWTLIVLIHIYFNAYFISCWDSQSSESDFNWLRSDVHDVRHVLIMLAQWRWFFSLASHLIPTYPPENIHTQYFILVIKISQNNHVFGISTTISTSITFIRCVQFSLGIINTLDYPIFFISDALPSADGIIQKENNYAKRTQKMVSLCKWFV